MCVHVSFLFDFQSAFPPLSLDLSYSFSPASAKEKVDNLKKSLCPHCVPGMTPCSGMHRTASHSTQSTGPLGENPLLHLLPSGAISTLRKLLENE